MSPVLPFYERKLFEDKETINYIWKNYICNTRATYTYIKPPFYNSLPYLESTIFQYDYVFEP